MYSNKYPRVDAFSETVGIFGTRVGDYHASIPGPSRLSLTFIVPERHEIKVSRECSGIGHENEGFKPTPQRLASVGRSPRTHYLSRVYI